MEQPLTPPPSFRVLRVRTRPRTRTISDENKCGHIAPVGTKEQFPVLRKEPSPVRGRTRSRIMRNGLALNTNFARPHVPIGLPTCCSPPLPSHGEAGIDDDLIFTMSPIQTHSPTLPNFDLAHEARSDANPNRVKQPTAHTLSAMWEKHKTYLTGAASQPHTPRTPGSKRPRADSHQRGFSDTHANVFPRRPRFSDQRSQQGSKPLLDLSPSLDAAPLDQPSPLAEGPFMYSFPSFDSSPLVKARQARARRQASKTPVQGEFLTGSLESEPNACGKDVVSDVKVESEPKQRLGPIRARKLRIQSGETLSDDLDDANYISRAFKSASLDPEKESDLDDTESFDTVYFSSQRSSSISSSSTDDADDQSIGHMSSILASFPVRRSTRSRTHSSSRSREHSCRRSPSKVDPEVNATAMMTRGRASRRASAEIRQQVPSAYTGGDRRGRGRTLSQQRRVGDDE